MPRGPRGEKRPADVIGNAVRVMRIATGEEAEDLAPEKYAAAVELGRKGGVARAKRLPKVQQVEIARLGGAARRKPPKD